MTAQRKTARPEDIEVVGDAMAEIYAEKTGAERLAIAAEMFRSARSMLLSHLQAEHPDWSEERIREEAARRLSHGAV